MSLEMKVNGFNEVQQFLDHGWAWDLVDAGIMNGDESLRESCTKSETRERDVT